MHCQAAGKRYASAAASCSRTNDTTGEDKSEPMVFQLELTENGKVTKLKVQKCVLTEQEPDYGNQDTQLDQ